MEFRTYLIRRLLLLVPVLIGVTVLIFGLFQFFPPHQRAMLYVSDPRQLANIDEIIELYGLNASIWQQYFTWLGQLFQGNLGWSLPTFWLGLILLMVFYGFFSGLFPPERLSTEMSVLVHSASFTRYTNINFLDGLINWEWGVIFDSLRHMVLPVVTLSVVNIAFIMRLMRSSMLESLGKGYILMARAKGLPEGVVVNKHARRNAMIPVLTVSGYLFAAIVNGVVITESIFNYKGLGWWAWRTAVMLDVSSILGFALFNGILFVLTNLVVDLLYARFDPRVRLGGSIS